MKGRYTTRSVVLGVLIIGAFILLGYVISPGKMIEYKYVIMVVLFGLIFLSNYLPCSFEADESGFTIKHFVKKYRFEYDDVAGVRYEYIPHAYRKSPYVKLIVDTHDGRTKKFRENARNEERSELVKLCAYLNRRC